MSRAPKQHRLTILAAACLVLAAALVIVGTRRDDPHANTQADNATQPGATGTSGTQPRGQEATLANRRTRGQLPAATASRAVGELVGDLSRSDREVTAELFNIVENPQAGTAERLEALENALNLVDDAQPERLISLANRSDLPQEINARILADALNRPPRLQGFILIGLLSHLKGDSRLQAIDFLSGLIGEDAAQQPVAWRQAVEKLP